MSDPTSTIHAKLARAHKTMRQNDIQIARLVAKGLTREQAYKQLLPR